MKKIILDLFNPENKFFKLTENSKRLTHISLSSFILPVIFLAIAGTLTQLVFAPLFFGESNEAAKWVREVFTLIVLFGTAIALIFLWIRFFEGRSISSLGFIKEGAVKSYLSGFAFGIILNTIVVLIMAMFGSIEIAAESTNITGVNAIGIVVLFLFGFVVQGAGEEILSRGWMFQVIGARYKPWIGVLITSIFFALIHLGNSGVNPASVINLILVAVLLILFVMNEGSLWFACAWHSAWNWTLGNFYGLSVSGKGDVVSIFDLNTTGNELISGGGFGPEGSLVTTFV
ncbi:MAG: CPBP family intramembrane metalloprotease, partial [Ignavibacteriae bacterium]|nr:CPBP family intramembrane metalloprotease [Ignavibacteriota bacterium]